MAIDEENKVLSGDDAVALWKQGKDKWNAWVDEHSDWSIGFFGVDFTRHLNRPGSTISFDEFRFSDGTISFGGAQFGDGDVRFDDARFGDGDVRFDDAEFGEGDVWFIRAEFGDGNVWFHNAQFDDGNVWFSDAQFGDSIVSFDNAQFGDVNVSFSGAQFGTGSVWFDNAKFGDGDVRFSDAQFGDSTVSFDNAQFGDGTVSFDGAQFGNGRFGNGRFKANNVEFAGRVIFADIIGAEKLTAFSLRGSSFAKSLDISSEKRFGCVPDLTMTKTANQVTLEGVRCDFERTEERFFRAKAKDRDDSTRFRRLKEIALQNRHHAQALDFHVGEMQASRWHYDGPVANWSNAALEFFYMLWGDYGRSVMRPVLWLLCTLAFFAIIYGALGSHNLAEFFREIPDALSFSSSQMLSFIPINVTAREAVAKALFGEGGITNRVILIAHLQSILSVILIFLLGLGLRNRFRV